MHFLWELEAVEDSLCLGWQPLLLISMSFSLRFLKAMVCRNGAKTSRSVYLLNSIVLVCAALSPYFRGTFASVVLDTQFSSSRAPWVRKFGYEFGIHPRKFGYDVA